MQMINPITHHKIIIANRERSLLILLSICFMMAFLGHYLFPLTPDAVAWLLAKLGLHAHLGGHAFIDQREWLGIPNAANVLSNIPYALFGVWGLWRVLIKNHQAQACSVLSWVLNTFFVGLICVTLGSSLYHLMPSDTTLLWDRSGMAIAFAGIFALAVYDKVSVKSSLLTLKFLLFSACLALLAWHTSQDVLPWSFIQFGSIAIVVWLALLKKTLQHDNTMSFSDLNGISFMNDIANLGGVIDTSVSTPMDSNNVDTEVKMGFSLMYVAAFYGLAKVFEANDAAIFEMTAHYLSGHTLKHLVSSLVALPVMTAFLKLKH
jgi:hypothetical protein